MEIFLFELAMLSDSHASLYPRPSLVQLLGRWDPVPCKQRTVRRAFRIKVSGMKNKGNMEDKHFQEDSVREEEEVRSMQSEITILLPSSQESGLLCVESVVSFQS